mgnify:CR=1 FL=1
MTTATEATVAELTEKIDRLTAQVEFLTEEAMAAKVRRREWDELKSDVTPLFGEMYSYAARELAEVEHDVSLDQIAHLLKRLLRNAGTLEGMLDQLESVSELVNDVAPLTGDAVFKLMQVLSDFEQRGYFGFAQASLGVADKVVTSFTTDDVDRLGENVVLILQAVREMTQPEVMLMLRNTATTVREQEIDENISLFGLIKQMRDPAVKRGMARALSALRSVSGELPQQPEQ